MDMGDVIRVILRETQYFWELLELMRVKVTSCCCLEDHGPWTESVGVNKTELGGAGASVVFN